MAQQHMTLREYLTEAQAKQHRVQFGRSDEGRNHQAEARYLLESMDSAALDMSVTITPLEELYAADGLRGILAHPTDGHDTRYWLYKEPLAID